MTEMLLRLNSTLNRCVWGWPMILLLMGTGPLLTVLPRAVQFRRLRFAPFNEAWSSGLTEAAVSVKAFETGLPGTFGNIVVTGGRILFAYSTLLGWSYYRETGIVHLPGAKAAMPCRFAWLVFV